MGKHQSYKLSAASAEERAEWIEAIRYLTALPLTTPYKTA